MYKCELTCQRGLIMSDTKNIQLISYLHNINQFIIAIIGITSNALMIVTG
jgi:hypothetical protein